MTHGAVRMWLKLEGLAALVVALWFYAQHPGGWTRFAVLFFAPDLAFLAYLAGPRAGAAAYNLVHSYSLPLGSAPYLPRPRPQCAYVSCPAQRISMPSRLPSAVRNIRMSAGSAPASCNMSSVGPSM